MWVSDMEFYILDSDGTKVDILQNVSSIQWHTAYYTTGTFEIHCKATESNLAYLRDGYRIWNTDTNEIGFVRYTYPSIDMEGHDELEIHGYLDNLDLRINPTMSSVKNVETDLYALVEKNKRDLDITCAAVKGLTATVDHDTTWESLRDSFQAICQEVGYGYRMLKNGNTLNQIELYERGLNENVKFSDKIGNIQAQSFLRDTSDYYNYAYVAGAGKSDERYVIEIDMRKNGEPRRELYVDAKNVQRTYTDANGKQQTYTDDQYHQVVYNYGYSKLMEHRAKSEFECTVNSNDSLYTYRKDYFVGDIVPTESVKYGINTKMRITGANLVIEDSTKVNLVLEEIE